MARAVRVSLESREGMDVVTEVMDMVLSIIVVSRVDANSLLRDRPFLKGIVR